MAKARVDQLVVGAVPGDAIFNEALFLRAILRRRGYTSDIYANRISPTLSRGQALEAGTYQPRSNSTMIFHYSIGSRLNAMVRTWPVRLILIYHNITPPEFFRSVNPQIEAEVAQGRAELDSFRTQTVLALADSEFNRLELAALGYEQTGVLPLSFTLTERAEPDALLMDSLNDGATNLLFVGRIAPNKKQDDLLRLLYLYRQLDATARLILVGSWGSTERYLTWLKGIAAALGIESNVIFAGHIPDAQLLAYYRQAHLFVCMSEHEGFCVPLVEAMSTGVPVVAYDSTGVPYTLGGAGILVKRKQWDVIAALCDTLVSDESLRRMIVAHQKERARAFEPPRVQGIFEQHLMAAQL